MSAGVVIGPVEWRWVGDETSSKIFLVVALVSAVVVVDPVHLRLVDDDLVVCLCFLW